MPTQFVPSALAYLFTTTFYTNYQLVDIVALVFNFSVSAMTSEGLGVMFEGDFADTCAEIFSLMTMGGRAEGLACADPGARTPIGASGNFFFFFFFSFLVAAVAKPQ